MDLFVENVPFSASELDVIELLAKALHSPEFTKRWPGAPINFKMTLHRDKKKQGHRHGGTGVLTLPYADIGKDFLQCYGRWLRLKGHLLCVSLSRRPTSVAIEPLRNTPFQDPAILRAKEKLESALAEIVPVGRLQFGWIDRDGVFSIEWERVYDDSTSQLSANMGFKAENREVYVEEYARVVYPSQAPRIVLIKISSVERVKRDISDTSLILTLYNAPNFEQKPRNVLGLPYGHAGERRTRHSSMDDPAHARVAQYTSLAIRVCFNTTRDTRRVLDMAATAKLPSPATVRAPPERRGHFSIEYLAEADRLIKQLDWPVAFQCSALLSQMTISPQELAVHCYPYLARVIAVQGVFFAAEAVRKFGDILRAAGPQFPNHVRGTHMRRVQQHLQATLFAAAEVVIAASALKALPSLDAIVQTYHVSVTPTGFGLSGPFPEQVCFSSLAYCSKVVMLIRIHCQSNRVSRLYREYQHCFLRVNFTDEEKLQYRWDRDVDGTAFIRERVGGTLKVSLDVQYLPHAGGCPMLHLETPRHCGPCI